MKKKLFFAAVALVAFASCTSDDFIGDVTTPLDNSPSESDAIVFSSASQGSTRADIGGDEAAKLLGYNFYVTGTKGTEGTANPTTNIVFDNYLVRYTTNTAGTTTSNTANWEYVGVSSDDNHVKLSSLNAQTIKYWDYSTAQYDFLAFSTGTFAAVSGSSTASTNIGVTAMKYGADLAGSAVAYTFDIPSVNALKQTYISDITEVEKANYGKEVTLKFKNLGSKVRLALYETVPGYAVKDVTFYTVDGTTNFAEDVNKSATATLISANAAGLPIKGKIEVYFPYVGTTNATNGAYDKAFATVTAATTGGTEPYQAFDDLDNFATTKEGYEADDDYLGRTLPTATFAGEKNAGYYQTVFPVNTSSALTLRVDYTLVATDGSGEEIHIYGAKAVVPATYTKWLPNYAYTYIFKISDNTNGWTSPNASSDNTEPGLFPITFDAVVTEATDATGEQPTITTVATPSITTYQQNHDITKDEYSIATGKNIYVQVMDNSGATATLVSALTNANSLLYVVDATNASTATEAKVMDALEKRTTAINADDVTGRNGITLTKNTNISNTVTAIVNGADNNPITVASGSAAEIAIASLAAGTYAYVYDYTTGDKTTVNEFQPIAVTGTTVGEDGKTYYTLTTGELNNIAVTTAAETVSNDYIYFSKTTNGTGTTTYSYISIAGKAGQTLPAGVVKVAKTTLTNTVAGGSTKEANTFYFERYITNNGKYAVKVIKIVA